LGKKLSKKDLEPEERSTEKFLKMKKFGWITKLPIIKQLYRKKHSPRGFDVEAAQIIPVNLRVGDYESEVIPLKLMDYFIEKAGTIVLRDCPCRVTNDCQNHDKDLGCVWMGKGAANLDLKNLPGMGKEGRYATKEEAREHVRKALKNGLVPALAKLRGDAVVYNVLDYEDEFMNFCFCCSCCCITAGYKYGNSDYKNYIKPMKGVSITTDPEKCEGCGECFKVCIYNGLKMVNGKSVHTDNCLACGHCEMVCPNGAISVNFNENVNIDEVMDGIIKRYEKIVDISG
jgi:NAD-dependent dihydropyrimidine dehydrogenase PreA subunit